MIYSVEGKLEAIGSDYVVINTSGVGFKVMTPSPQANYVGGIGQKLKLYTYMHVREDALVLFGFKTPSDLELFQILINVTGVGPKVGLAMLSTYDSKTLATAIISRLPMDKTVSVWPNASRMRRPVAFSNWVKTSGLRASPAVAACLIVERSNLERSSLMKNRYIVGGAQKVVMLYCLNIGRMSSAENRSKS